jgi:hypothetical protein
LIKNSWGETDFIRSPFDSTAWPVLGGRYITAVTAPNASPSMDAAWVGRWQMDHDGWRGELVIRRTTDYRAPDGQETKLGDYYRDGHRWDVNGRTLDGGRQLDFWIADSENRVPAGEHNGQEFSAYLFSWDYNLAAGVTSWSGSPFGVSLSRMARTGSPSQSFDAARWVGRWLLDHDGWRGTLHVTSVAPFQASYARDGQPTLPVSGGPLAGREYELEFTIPFAADNQQPFQLYGFTHEDDVAAGTTESAGATFGVLAQRQQIVLQRPIGLDRARELAPVR